MNKFVWDVEKAFLEEFEERPLELPNGEIIKVDMARVHWNWYDREEKHVQAENLRHNPGNGLLYEEIKKTGPMNPSEAGDFLSELMVEHVYAQIYKGIDPFETPGQRVWRHSVEWKLKKSRGDKAA